jgi:signal peptidase II
MTSDTPPSPAGFRWQPWFWPWLVGVLVLDQLTKFWLFALPQDTRLPGWIERSCNRGVAWGMFQHRPGAVALLTAVLIPVLAWVWWRHFRRLGRCENLAFGAILGGAVGNGIDRLLAQLGRLDGVRDFIRVDLHPVGIDYVWPTFNLADSGITTGFALLALLALAKAKPAPAKTGAPAAV